jgi:hypothetical protein
MYVEPYCDIDDPRGPMCLLHIHTHTHIYIYTYTYIHTHTYICIYIHTYIHTNVYTGVEQHPMEEYTVKIIRNFPKEAQPQQGLETVQEGTDMDEVDKDADSDASGFDDIEELGLESPQRPRAEYFAGNKSVVKSREQLQQDAELGKSLGVIKRSLSAEEQYEIARNASAVATQSKMKSDEEKSNIERAASAEMSNAHARRTKSGTSSMGRKASTASGSRQKDPNDLTLEEQLTLARQASLANSHVSGQNSVTQQSRASGQGQTDKRNNRLTNTAVENGYDNDNDRDDDNMDHDGYADGDQKNQDRVVKNIDESENDWTEDEDGDDESQEEEVDFETMPVYLQRSYGSAAWTDMIPPHTIELMLLDHGDFAKMAGKAELQVCACICVCVYVMLVK